MAYELFDATGRLVTQADLQSRGAWFASKEEVLVAKHGRQLDLIINPDGCDDPQAPGLLNIRTKALADLKVQNTPFFQAGTRYRLDPQHAIVLNRSDIERYARTYPTVELYLWIDWVVTRLKSSTEISVQPMTGIWHIPFGQLGRLVADAPVHYYQQRTRDAQEHSRESYVLDLRNPAFRQLV